MGRPQATARHRPTLPDNGIYIPASTPDPAIYRTRKTVK